MRKEELAEIESKPVDVKPASADDLIETLMSFDRNGEPLAVYYNYAVHGVIAGQLDQQISQAVQEGAAAYLRRQYMTITVVGLVVAAIKLQPVPAPLTLPATAAVPWPVTMMRVMLNPMCDSKSASSAAMMACRRTLGIWS